MEEAQIYTDNPQFSHKLRQSLSGLQCDCTQFYFYANVELLSPLYLMGVSAKNLNAKNATMWPLATSPHHHTLVLIILKLGRK